MSLALQITRSAAVVLLVALAACGGGGESEPAPPLQRNDPVRDWEFSVHSSDGTTAVVPGPDGSGTQTGGLFERIADFGPMPLDEELFTFTGAVAANGRAKGLVFGTADGVTYGVFAEAPFGKLGGINQPGGPNPIGSHSRLDQRQSFIKRAADASLTFTLTDVFICAFDYNLFPPTFGTDDAHTAVRGEVSLVVSAWTKQQRVFYSVSGAAIVVGTRAAMTPIVQNFASAFTRELWNDESFDFTSKSPIPGDTGLESGGLGFGREGCLELKGAITHTVDLSTVAVGEEFTLRSVAEADTENRRGGGAIRDHQASGVNAYLRDPLSIRGMALTFVGLEPSNRPDRVPPVQAPIVPASCVPGSASDPAAGVLQFSSASYTVGESAAALQTITVSRSGGSSGAVSATFATSDGTAVAGADYTPVNTTVFFAAGNTAPRTVVVPIIGNTIDEPDKTVNLTLSQPGGCAALGAQTTAVLTIEDDDRPSPASLPTGIDTGFANAGKAFLSGFGGNGSAMALQGDGKIVMAGGSTTDFVLARFNADGSLDAGFGSGGQVTTDLIGGSADEEVAGSVAIQPDGKIIVVGYTSISGRPGRSTGNRFDFALVRYNADGSLDSSFGSGGKVTAGVIGRAFAVALQRDGKIVVAGDSPLTQDFSLARYNTDGSLDSGFGIGGQLTTDVAGAANVALNVVLQSNGAIVASGAGFDHTDVVRYNANGSLDNSFGVGGKLVLAGTLVGQGLALQGDGKLVLVGGATEVTTPATARFVVMRLNADGSPDTGFGNAGKVDTAFNESARASAVALQRDGKIVAVGARVLSPNANFIAARYNTDGSLDAGFGVSGVLSFDFFFLDDIGESVVVQADGKIVVGGGVNASRTEGYGLVRINP